MVHVGIQRGGPGVWTPLKNHKNIGFLCNSGPDPLKNYEATKPAFNVGQSSACQQNAILMVFCWRADDGPFIVVFGSSHHSSTKKKKQCQSWTPSDKISGFGHVVNNRPQNYLLARKRVQVNFEKKTEQTQQKHENYPACS